MKDLIQCAPARDDFLKWLNWGNGPLTIHTKENASMVFKFEMKPNTDYQYCQRQAENVDFRRNRMSFFGGQHSSV
ncbi:MAG: hypothetical protein K2P49_02530, partial [Oscillospiraceae bacterium]|nr:hypothetical protein [Oscillospiraceae bacterium]